jgi:hypothetical protein
MAMMIVLTVVQVVCAGVGIASGLRYRSVHKCSVCGKRPFTLYRCEWPDGRWERRCEQHLQVW